MSSSLSISGPLGEANPDILILGWVQGGGQDEFSGGGGLEAY